jgi:phage shock protein PspC (stress-responsive transcriptional regulator)
MRHSYNVTNSHKEHHPQVSIGLFFILLGVALLIATNDWLKLGGIKEYFTWETAMIFIGVLLLLNLNFFGGLIMISIGAWFWIDDRYGYIPELLKTIYWPVVIMSAGVVFILTSLIKRKKQA